VADTSKYSNEKLLVATVGLPKKTVHLSEDEKGESSVTDVGNNRRQSGSLGFSYRASSMLYNKSYQLMRLL